MTRYKTTLEDLAKRTGERRIMALEALLDSEATPTELAETWNIHPISAYRVLERLRKKNYVERDGEGVGALYNITTIGEEKLVFLKDRQQALSLAGMTQETRGADYESLGSLGSLVNDPVALQRLVEVDYTAFVDKGLRALPGGRKLDKTDIITEKKYDGWLTQAAGGTLYSRRGQKIAGKMPPIDKALRKFRREHLIGELVYWDPDGKMDERFVTSVAGTKTLEDASAKMHALERKGGFFQVVYFDVIAAGGKDVSRLPFAKRREILAGLIKTEDDREARITLSPVWELKHWKKVFQASNDEGGEGVVLKNLKAPYFWAPLGEREPKRAGSLWKIKSVSSDDFIVISGRWTDKDSLVVTFGQFHRGEIVIVGEVNNFSAELEEEMEQRLERGPFVVELEFQERFPKPPGRLRNPRFKRFRPDKPIDSVVLPEQFAP